MNEIIKNLFDRVLATEKKTKQLEVSEKLFSSIAQTATDAIIITDANSKIIFCNQKASEMFGYTEQEMLDMNITLLLPERYRQADGKGITRFVAQNRNSLKDRTLELEGVKKGGNIFPIELSLSFWEQKDVFFTAIIRDITKRKQIEQEIIFKNRQLQQANEKLLGIQAQLKEANNELEARVEQRTQALADSERQLRLITDALPVLISYVDREEKYRFTNQAYEWWFKLDREAILGKTMKEIAGETAYNAVKEKIAQVLNGQSVSFEQEMKYQRVDTRHVSFNLIPHWEGQEVVGFYLLANDITARKKAEQEARAASERFRLLLESIPHLAWTSTPGDLSINFFNKQWYEYTGLTPEQSLGFSWQQALHPDDLALALERRTVGRRENKPYAVENRYRHHNGTYRWHLARIVPIISEKGDVILWIGTATDIHDQKMLEAALQTTTQELSASNEELRSTTEELQASNKELWEANQVVLEINEKLEKANKELEASNGQMKTINRDLDNFIYTASHDLKAPIANIEGLTMALIKKLTAKFMLDDDQNQILSLIASSVDRLKLTIANLTEIAKAQKEDVEEEIVSVDKVLEEVVQDLAKLIGDTEIIIHKHIEVDQVNLAQKNLRSILYNLLSNAVKYRSLEKVPQVHIETKIENGFILIAVKDNGIGIAQNHIQKLFTMFKRFHTHVEGTGIGLYIIKRIVENAGGKIEVESIVNEGTTFKIYLPYDEADKLPAS